MRPPVDVGSYGDTPGFFPDAPASGSERDQADGLDIMLDVLEGAATAYGQDVLSNVQGMVFFAVFPQGYFAWQGYNFWSGVIDVGSEGYAQDGIWGGIAAGLGQIANVFVPVVDAGIGLAKTIDAVEKGDYKRAGESGYGAAKAVAGVLAVGIGAGVARGGGGGGSVRIGGERWRAFEPGAKVCQNGCEMVAQSIQRSIGGDVKVITGPGKFLGRVRNTAGEFVNPAGSKGDGWYSHHVVVKDGRVYDSFTGPEGMSVSSYKQLWEYNDVLHFGF